MAFMPVKHTSMKYLILNKNDLKLHVIKMVSMVEVSQSLCIWRNGVDFWEEKSEGNDKCVLGEDLHRKVTTTTCVNNFITYKTHTS